MSLTGYRWWYAAHRPETGWQLRSVFQRRWWHGPHYEAPAPPRSRNSCGIHAFKTWELAAGATQFGPDNLYRVFGVVALWGKVVEHERGYRAEHALIRRLIVPERIVFNHRSRLEEPCCLVDLDDVLTKWQGPPSPAPLLGACVIAGERKWQRTAGKTPDRATQEKTPDRAMRGRFCCSARSRGHAVSWRRREARASLSSRGSTTNVLVGGARSWP